MKKIVKIVLIAFSSIIILLFTAIILFKGYYGGFPVSNNLDKYREDYTKLMLLIPSGKAYGFDFCSLDKENKEICNTMTILKLKSVGNFSDEIYFIEKPSWWSGINRIYLYRKNGWEGYKKELDEVDFQILDENWATYTQKPFL